MSAAQQVLAAERPVFGNGRWRPAWRGHLQISDLTWAIAFVVPYAAVFFAFAVYPIAPWNYMMALAIVYALPPIAVFYALRRYLVAALTLDRVRR